MQTGPRWFLPVAIIALLWNLLGCFAFLADVWLFGLSGAAAHANPVAFVLQGLVLVIAVALVMLGRRASAQGWVA